MHSEAFASAKYKRYAAFARSREHEAYANLLTSMADDCRIENFASELKLSGAVGDDVANLKDVLQDLQYHIERYCQFAVQAKNDDDEPAALLFSSVAHRDEGLIKDLQKAIDGTPAT